MTTDAQREAVTTALAENCVGEPGSDMHSWRCSHPDVYGPCDCLAGTVTDVINAVRPLIEADLRERLAAAIEAEDAIATLASFIGRVENDTPGLHDIASAVALWHARIVRERP